MRLFTCTAILAVLTEIQAKTTADPVMAGPLYKRIHIKDRSEYPRVYELLEEYATNPDSAATVKEIAFRPYKSSGSLYLFRSPAFEELRAAEANRTVPNDEVVFQRLKHLELSSEQEQEWAKSLTWMKPELRKERIPSGDERDERAGMNFKIFVAKLDDEFAYYATALILTLCPNVERFTYIDNEPRNPLKKILRLNNYGLLSHNYLQQLKHIVLLGTDDHLFGDDRFYVSSDILELIRMFHRLPKIESISAEAMDSPRNDYEETFPANTTNIKKISLTHSCFGSNVIAALIRAPKALEEVTITRGGRGSWDGSSGLLYSEEIGRALLCQKASLVKADLDLGHTWPIDHYYDPGNPPRDYSTSLDEWDQLASREYRIDRQEEQRPLRAMELTKDREYGRSIGSLHDFERLTHLYISIRHLLGESHGDYFADPPDGSVRLIDILPPNLEHLLLRGYKKGEAPHLDDQIDEMLKLKSERIPMLQHIYGVDEYIAEGDDIGHPDQNLEKLWSNPEIDRTWHVHEHDEL